ncbi:hypothetical protein TRFO_24413 [Tritrichomonas foetus]|uniref:Sorting nexin/Vps5-like C-terminal domain-containing protein n=1 Tax=Tritrichomonas foetus TaxID=1144522 RepID=A0A1J4KD70_9EUKA|nr:hypothetical protein TRFO_24413 [Tritrichomonas foetus]|eukprot:OHT07397.1 hypothetical protein TRFO_24413 [Tritrichomonas foetus]
MFSSNLHHEIDTAGAYKRIYSVIEATGNKRLLLSQQLTTFAQNLEAMVLSDTLHYGSAMHDIMNVLTAIININTRIANSEIRCSEDLKDVIARFKVVKATSRDQFAAMRSVDEATKKLVDAELKDAEAKQNLTEINYAEKSIKLKQNIDAARELKRSCLQLAKEKTIRLIEVQEKYNAFKIGRQVHAWAAYAYTMKQDYEKLAQLFECLANAVSELRSTE